MVTITKVLPPLFFAFNIVMRTPLYINSIIVLLLLAGCGQPERHLGSWHFDKEYSESEAGKRYPVNKEPEEKPLFGGFAKDLHSKLASQMIDQLEGFEISFSESEISVVKRDGSGESFEYELIDDSEPNSVRIRTKEGKISTYFFEGKRMYLKSDGDVGINLYFSRIR